jgi:Caspase domain
MAKAKWILAPIIALLTCLSLPVIAPALDSRGLAVKSERLALVIGNSAYPTAPLKNPVNDAEDLAGVLSAMGFKVSLKKNVDKRTMEESIRNFGRQLKGGGVGLFYFAGHGMQVEGQNYLIPVNAKIESESDIKYEAVDAGLVLGKMEDAGNQLNIVILDACRNNPFSRSFRNAATGLARMDAPTGSLIAYSTAPGAVAADGSERNGVFTKHLIKHLATPDLTVEQVLKRVRVDVAAETHQHQIPWESSSLMGEFYFSSAQTAPALKLPGSSRFDGAWTVEIKCTDHTEGKTLARGYAFQFPAEVKDGVLHGQHKTKGAPGSLTIDGKIQPDGTAELHANGVTDAPEYTVNHVVKGTPYAYRINAHFDDSQGTGSRIEGRTCRFGFAKR